MERPGGEEPMSASTDIDGYVRTAGTIAAAMMAGPVVLFIAEEVIRARFRPFFGFIKPTPGQVVRYLLFAVAALIIFAIRTMRRKMFTRHMGEEEAAFLARLTSATVIILAVSDIPAVLGFTLFLMAGLNLDFYVLLFVSIFLFYMFFPRRSAWTLLARRS